MSEKVRKAEFQNILIVRTDRIGDVVLSLPMISTLASTVPKARISFLLRSYTRELAEGQPGLDAILLYDEVGRPKAFLIMLAELRSHRFDLAVVASPTFRLALLLSLARISTRVGTGYRWYSILFNRRVYEHRKTAERHELEYNFSLLAAVGCSFERYPGPVLSYSREHSQAAGQLRSELGIANDDHVIILHPGSGGSARDWKPGNFALLAHELRKKKYRVLITGGPGEERLVETVVSAAGAGVIPLVNRLGLKELAAFLARADLFISNSTGPLHIAAAVGTPVIGFYPPILACSPQRWGPYTDRKFVFVPDRNKCPRCQGGPCEADDCMEQIEVGRVVQEVERLVPMKRNNLAEVHS